MFYEVVMIHSDGFRSLIAEYQTTRRAFERVDKLNKARTAVEKTIMSNGAPLIEYMVRSN